MKYELIKLRDFAGFAEITYRVEPNYWPHCQLLPITLARALEIPVNKLIYEAMKL